MFISRTFSHFRFPVHLEKKEVMFIVLFFLSVGSKLQASLEQGHVKQVAFSKSTIVNL